jgi:hypothetical protein
LYRGAPGASAAVLLFVASRPITLPKNLAGSQAVSTVAATAAAVFGITKNGSAIGSVTFALGASVGTFTFAAAVSLAAGDVLQITSPASPDGTLANVAITISGSY